MLNPAILLSTLLMSTPPEPTVDVLSGSWWVIGNGTPGELLMQIAADGNVTGTIYGQAITGKFDANSKQLTFKRFPTPKVGKDAEAVQEWSGLLNVAHKNSVANFQFGGKFKATHSKDWGELGVEYVWTGQATRRPSPASELQVIQGSWAVGSVTNSNRNQHRLPDEMRLTDRGNKITIEKNQILSDGRTIATITNDVPSKSLNEEVGLHGYRFLMLTLPDGRGLNCSYIIDEHGIEIAYPHTTSCHRGSGQITRLTRPAQAQP